MSPARGADRHVFDHTPAERADFSHRKLLSGEGGSDNPSLSDRAPSGDPLAEVSRQQLPRSGFVQSAVMVGVARVIEFPRAGWL